MDQLTEQVMQMVSSQLAVPLDRITAETTFEELNIDSLHVIELGLLVEERYNIAIPNESVRGFKTLGDVIRFVHSQVDAPAQGPAVTVDGRATSPALAPAE